MPHRCSLPVSMVLPGHTNLWSWLDYRQWGLMNYLLAVQEVCHPVGLAVLASIFPNVYNKSRAVVRSILYGHNLVTCRCRRSNGFPMWWFVRGHSIRRGLSLQMYFLDCALVESSSLLWILCVCRISDDKSLSATKERLFRIITSLARSGLSVRKIRMPLSPNKKEYI